jgi:hypothetical protein
MGWYFRKSFGFGPVRVNLSKSGMGILLEQKVLEFLQDLGEPMLT